MLSKRKYFGSLAILCLAVLVALVCLPDLLAALAVASCTGGAFGLVLKGNFGAAHQARRRHESLLSLIKDEHALNKERFDDAYARVSRLEELIGHAEHRVSCDEDADKERENTSEDIKRRSTAEWKIRIMDDLATIREILEHEGATGRRVQALEASEQ